MIKSKTTNSGVNRQISNRPNRNGVGGDEKSVISNLKKSSSKLATQIRHKYYKKKPQDQPPHQDGLKKLNEMESTKQPQWFHGLLPREEVQLLLRKNGDFLVRMSEPSAGQTRHLILSVMQNDEGGETSHYVIRAGDGTFSITEKETFFSLLELVSHHKTNKINEDIKTSVLLNPIGRQTWELNHEDVTMTKTLGEGAFGEVKLGTLRMGSKTVDCAVKVAKLEKCTKEQIKEITSEARLMRGFDHRNVVRCYGVAAIEEPLLVVMELVQGGGLDGYLQKNEVQWTEKLDIVSQVACGLDYIHKKNIMHRDIACRNILYGNNIAKVSDFGLSRVGTEYQMDPSKKVPIKWLPPETLATFIYTPKTDVFAFAILCWEVIENGAQPYPNMKVVEVHQKVIRDDYRMTIGEAPPGLIDIIKKCWQRDPNARPQMAQVCQMMLPLIGKKEPPKPNKSYSVERAKIFGSANVATAQMSDPCRDQKTTNKTGRRNNKKRQAAPSAAMNSAAMISSPSSGKEVKKKGGKSKRKG